MTLATGPIVTALYPLNLINQIIAVVHVPASLHIRCDRLGMLHFVQIREQVGLCTLRAGINLEVRRAGTRNDCAAAVPTPLKSIILYIIQLVTNTGGKS